MNVLLSIDEVDESGSTSSYTRFGKGFCTYDIYVVHSRNGGHHDIERRAAYGVRTGVAEEQQHSSDDGEEHVGQRVGEDEEGVVGTAGEGNYKIKGGFEVRFFKGIR